MVYAYNFRANKHECDDDKQLRNKLQQDLLHLKHGTTLPRETSAADTFDFQQVADVRACGRVQVGENVPT